MERKGQGMDHRRFLKLFLADEHLIKSYLLSGTGRSAEAEELLQEVSSVLWEKFEQYDPKRPFRAWALGVARMEVLKWKQRKARDRSVQLTDTAITALANTADAVADEAEARRVHLKKCMKKLSDKAQDVVKLRYFENLSIRSLAEKTGRSVQAMEMMLVRIRRSLRECVTRKLSGASEVSA